MAAIPGTTRFQLYISRTLLSWLGGNSSKFVPVFSSLTAGHGWLEAEAEAFQIEPGKDSTSTLTTAAWRQISGIQS